MVEHDEEMIRCPRVGGMINFRYCRLENSRLPCRWIVNCWRDRMDIEGFLKEHYTPEQLAQVFAPPKSRIQRLVELVEQARDPAQAGKTEQGDRSRSSQ